MPATHSILQTLLLTLTFSAFSTVLAGERDSHPANPIRFNPPRAAGQPNRVTNTNFTFDGIAYAHVSLSIRFGLNMTPEYELNASIYPRFRMDFPTRYFSGAATHLGYLYDSQMFNRYPDSHTEEINHIRQWEALGPALPLAYLLSFGEPFEPYDTRINFGLIPAASKANLEEEWNLKHMWMPEPNQERQFPQLRITWGNTNPTNIEVFPGYSQAWNAARQIIHHPSAPTQ